MESMKKREYKFKIVFNILYLIICLPGLSILFYFPPRYLLFNKNSKNFKNIIYLYKTFVKSIYENINKPFINNITISNNNSCPNNYEVLFIENDYYGKFSKFYGNSSVFCIEKFKEDNYNYEYLLSITNSSEKINECKEGTRKCGTLNKIENFPLCIDNNIQCPINLMIYGKINGANQIEFSGGYTLSTLTDQSKSVIVDIEIKNNFKLCLERYPIEIRDCEMFQSNECLIINGFEKIENQIYLQNIELSAPNLAKWNFINDDNIEHDYCKESNTFQVFGTGYVNFTYQNLLDFKTEFPQSNEKNNSLYETCNAFKLSEEYDILFYLISFILLCWSLTHFVIQLLYFFEKLNVKKCYFWNGIILFFFKLFSYFGIIIYHFFYYLKIKKVYLTLVDFPRNEVLNLYRTTRNSFITKIIILDIIGFAIISVDLIILFFTIIVKFRIDSIKNENVELDNTFIKQPEDESNKIINSRRANTYLPFSERKQNEIMSSRIKLMKEDQVKNESNNAITNNYLNNNNTTNNNNVESNNLENPFTSIELKFIFNNDSSKVYTINAKKGDIFSEVIKKLKSQYPELSELNMKVFSFGSNIINATQTVSENNLSPDIKIAILCN